MISSLSKVDGKSFGNFLECKLIDWWLGVAYQLTEHDPLIDSKQCELDAKQMQDLGANAIRVYHVDPTGDHSGCMKAFANVGIYLFVDLDTFSTQITQVRDVMITEALQWLTTWFRKLRGGMKRNCLPLRKFWTNFRWVITLRVYVCLASDFTLEI